jgi:hypothetical protein
LTSYIDDPNSPPTPQSTGLDNSVVATGTWCSFEIDEVVGWAADFDFSTPAQMLLDWQQVLFSAAERYGIFRVVEAEFRGYRRDRDGDIGGFLAHPDRVPRNDARFPRGFLPRALASRTASGDIWFPWTIQIFCSPTQDRVDNWYLSRLNGSRLNGFLAEVRAATLAAGGTWRMNPPDGRGMADEDGIRLDADPPT